MATLPLRHKTRSTGNDGLTGLPDRGFCSSILVAMIAKSTDPARPAAALWVNVDRFRQINHSFGYVVGDNVLVEIGRRLGRALPAEAVLGRVGADEFVILLPRSDASEAIRVGKELVKAIHHPLDIGNTRMRPSVSVGIALALPDEDAFELLERSERSMLEAKREGGGRSYMAADATLPQRNGKYLAREELAVEESLRRALESGGLFLEYQPIVRLADGEAIGAEALMRCRVDNRVMAPGRFIPVAEKTGLISNMGEWSLVTAALCARRMQARGKNLRMAVNVSRVQLQSYDFAKTLHGVIAYTGVDPAQLELEITESLFMDTSDVVRKNLREAMAAGFPLALDDFGTGYSSLACLKDLPASKIKLDRAFVIDLPDDMRSFGVARAVSRLAGDLGISVVAEGVETAEQMEVLCNADVSAVQGFHIARPMAEADLTGWLR
jgi:diguanylate cyclase (GGDEF)-like protein